MSKATETYQKLVNDGVIDDPSIEDHLFSGRTNNYIEFLEQTDYKCSKITMEYADGSTIQLDYHDGSVCVDMSKGTGL